MKITKLEALNDSALPGDNAETPVTSDNCHGNSRGEISLIYLLIIKNMTTKWLKILSVCQGAITLSVRKIILIFIGSVDAYDTI